MNQPETLKLVQQLGIVTLKADMTEPAPEAEALLTELGNEGLLIPYYAVYPADGGEPIVHLGGLTVEKVAELLNQAGPSRGSATATTDSTGRATDSTGSATDSTDGAENAASRNKPDPASRRTNDPVEPNGADQPDGENEPMDIEHPFAHRLRAPSLDGGVGWINTSGPIDLKQLRGKFVLLDFWTYCCINCIQLLPELKKLEAAYPNEVVVIGVHSAKFDAEKETQNILDAVLRYEIKHPVVNDANMTLWRKFGARAWPTIGVIDPEGYLVVMQSGEVPFEAFDQFFKQYLPIYRARGTLDETPLHFDLEADKVEPTPLRFPGKVLADEAGNRLFIADSNHNRIVITDLEGKLLEVIGSGAIGADDGDYVTASFDHPQGMALAGEVLYVADTENHLLRKVDLAARQVTTLAGTGVKGHGWPGMEEVQRGENPPERWVGPPRETALASPWSVLVHDAALYIAMAGPHQIWKMPLDESEIGPYAGNGREDVVDGPLLPRHPFAMGFSSFAQPSGLATDGTWLYVADSEGSSIRAVPFDPTKEVQTVVGTAHLPGGRLFYFGDQDGEENRIKLQHVLCVAHHDGKLYIADTYNNKIKQVDWKDRSVRTIAGSGEAGATDDPPRFREPAGLSYAKGRLYVADTNNHRIRTIDLANEHRVATLAIDGLQPPQAPATPPRPDFERAEQVPLAPIAVRPVDGRLRVNVELTLPAGWKMNSAASATYYLEASEAGPIDPQVLDKRQSISMEAPRLALELPLVEAAGEQTLRVLLTYYYCQDGEGGVCKIGSVAWTVPLRVREDASSELVTLRHEAR